MHGVASPALGPIRPTPGQREKRRRERRRLARRKTVRLAGLHSPGADWDFGLAGTDEDEDLPAFAELNDERTSSSDSAAGHPLSLKRSLSDSDADVNESAAKQGFVVPKLELPRNASSSVSEYAPIALSPQHMGPRSVRSSRRPSIGELSELSSYSTYCANLGEVATGTLGAESQIGLVYGADIGIQELQQLAAEGDSYAVALLDILDVLDTAETDVYLESKLRYITEEVLASMWGTDPDLPVSEEQQHRQRQTAESALHLRNLELYVITRIVLAQVDVVFQSLLKFLVELSNHLDSWRDLEDRPLRTSFIWTGRQMWRRFKAITASKTKGIAEEVEELPSLEAIIAHLEDMSIVHMEELGRLKEVLLQFEETDSVHGLKSMTVVCIDQIKLVLGIPSDSSTGFVSPTDDKSILLSYCTDFHLAMTRRTQEFRTCLIGFEELPRYVKYWPEICVGMVAGSVLTVLGMQHQNETVEFLSRVSYSWNEFYMEHVKKPLAALVDEIVFDHTLSVADFEATMDAKESLGRMLQDYLVDVNPSIDTDTLRDIVERLDVSIISKKYEEEMKKPITSLVNGDLVRMLLIQMQFMKKELLVVMTALDELIRENQFNLEVMATVPAFLVTWTVYQLGVQIVNAIRGSKRTKSYVFAQIRLMLRDVEQLLNLNNQDRKLLRGVSLGRLVLLLHQLESLVVSYTSFFDRHERKRLAEDVSELLSDHLHISQKLNTIQRMYRSYTFLQPTSRSLEALLRRLL